MNRNFDLQKFGCGQNGCGNHGALCPTCEKSFTASTEMKCLDENPRCSDKSPCDFCQSIAQSVIVMKGLAIGGGKARDVIPQQDFLSEEICDDCRKPVGSNPKCQICAFFKESAETAQNGDQNPNVPHSVVFQQDVGPRQGDLCALTPEAVQESVDFLRRVFMSMVLPLIPIASSIPDSHVGLWRGCEWFGGNCWFVVILQMFQTGSWHTSINVSNPLGNALWILVRELRLIGFVSRQRLQAFRRLMQEIIGQPEKGTLFERGQMDPFEVLKMLETAGAFIYHYSLSWAGYVEGVHATPVIALGKSESSSRDLTKIMAKLDIVLNFDQDFRFSSLPSTLVIMVSTSERASGSAVDFPSSSVFDIGPLTFQIMSALLFIHGHYISVLVRLKYNPQTETIYTTYWLSDSKSDVQDCGHHVPSIIEIGPERFKQLWQNYAISITCTRIHSIVNISGIDHEKNGSVCERLKPGWNSLPQCYPGKYIIFGQNGEILIKNCMSPLEFQLAFPPPPPAPCASGPGVPQAPSARVSPLPPPVPCAQVAQAVPQSEPTFSFNDGHFNHKREFPLSKWTYTYDLHGKVCFQAEGTFEDPLYSNRKYFYNGKEYCGSLIKTALRDAYFEFIEENKKK